MKKCVFDRSDFCVALNSRECENCRFRKTREELDVGREKACERVENLPKKQYNAIMNKYYKLRRGAEVEE